MQHVEAGLVRGKPRAHLLHAAERADGDAPVGLAAPRAAPVLESQQLLRGLLDEGLDGVLIAEPVAAGDGVVGVLVQAVVGGNHARGAAFGRDGVAAHRIDLHTTSHAEPGVGLGDGDRGAQTGPAASDEHDVVRGDHGGSRGGGVASSPSRDAAIIPQ